MKLEIDIPSIIYNDAKENGNYISVTKLEIAWKAIADGKPLEQESILDKIRAEIERLQKMCDKNDLNLLAQYSAFGMVLDILDKYKAESEGK